jgi:ABC-type uncharacterized transport system substrate-binding protein
MEVKRRDFIMLAGGVAASRPFAAFAAIAASRNARVGILLAGPAAAPRDLEITGDLARLGYVEGRDIHYEIRGAAGDLARLPALARELVALRPDALIGSTTEVARALSNATRDIPIVMTLVSDPIALGLSSSISRPTSNVTGFIVPNVMLSAKRLEILHEAVPQSRKVGYFWVPQNPAASLLDSQIRQAAATLGIALVSLPLNSEAGLAGAFARIDDEHATAVLVEGDPLTYRVNSRIIDECLLRDLPAIHAWAIEVRNGALMSYGPTEPENNAGAAGYLDRILKGAKVAELPFAEPTDIKLVINLRTARAIGITFPSTLLARADEVIE